jgi:outer membrane protein TolC
MTMNKKLFFLLALMLGTAGRASAQTDLSLTWDEARKMALEHNPAVKSARAAMEQADFSYFASLNSYMPQVSLSNSVTRSGGDASPASNRWGASVSASEDLLNLKTISSVRISRIAREQAEADYLSASASVRQNLGSAFIDLLFAQKRIEVQKKISGIRRENSKLIKLKYESGMESKGNSLYTSALAENADVSVKKAERQLFISQRSLLEAMGLEGTASVTAKGDISVPVFSLDEARIAQAIERSPDMV